MIDLQQLEDHLAAAVKQAVEAKSHKLRGGIAINELIVSTLAKPVLTFPDDVMAVLGVGRSTAFDLVKTDDTFPARSSVGRRQFVSTAAFMAWLRGRATT